ncbi:MAG: tape measure protein [Clostridiales bacterium]|nr:tape measure protein [Clostridiales bacterium]MDY4037652.1 tape measure protein [Candidatus Pseudoscilispira sp.]
MPDTSIVIKAEDRYSTAVRRMADQTRAFNKDIDALENNLYQLSKNKAQLRVDTTAAKKALKEAEKQFIATGDAADGLKLELAQANYDSIRRNLDLVTKSARDTERQLKKVSSASSEESSGSAAGIGKSGIGGVVSALGAAGAGQMISQIVQDGANIAFTSAYGSGAGSILSSGLSGAISGAAMGSLIAPGIGTAVGAAAGAALGAASGGMQVFQQQDEAFKSYVQEAVEGQWEEMDNTLQNGSTIAGSREQTRLAFAQRFGSDAAADDYLERVKTMAVKTNYGYDEIVGYSKLLLNSYAPDETLGVLTTLSDASAGLNLSTSDVEMMIAGLSRMRTTGKATQEYLNYFSERGVDVYSALGNYYGVDKSQIAGMVTAGQISGEAAAEAILQYIDQTFGGLSDRLSGTYDAMVDNLADAQSNIDAAMGEGYNEARKQGIQAQTDWLTGESGGMVEEAYKSIGAWRAELENQKEALIRQYVDEAMNSDEYQTAMAAGDAATAGRLIMEAKVKAQNEYNSSEGAQLLRESEKTMIQNVSEDTATRESYWNAGYELGAEFSKGRLAGMSGHLTGDAGDTIVVTGKTFHYQKTAADNAGGYATGLSFVPYNNFPALLHEGERVLTAAENRNYSAQPGNVVISGNNFTVRQESDIDAIAEALLQNLVLARMGGVSA